jgi:hypothetical protein
MGTKDLRFQKKYDGDVDTKSVKKKTKEGKKKERKAAGWLEKKFVWFRSTSITGRAPYGTALAAGSDKQMVQRDSEAILLRRLLLSEI